MTGDEPRDLRDVLPRLAACAASCLHVGEMPDCCILAGRVILDVCQALGLDAAPVVMHVAAFSPQAKSLLDAGTPLIQLPSSARPAWILGDDVVLREERRWRGHLVIHVREPAHDQTGDQTSDQTSDQVSGRASDETGDRLGDGGWIVDPTVVQMSRPERGIEVPAHAFALPRGWHPGKRSAAACHLATGTRLIYLPNPTARNYRETPDWNPTRLTRWLVGAVIRELLASAASGSPRHARSTAVTHDSRGREIRYPFPTSGSSGG